MMELKNNIVTLCNNSGLTIEQVLFVLKDAYRDAEDSYITFKAKQELKQEFKEQEDELEE